MAGAGTHFPIAGAGVGGNGHSLPDPSGMGYFKHQRALPLSSSAPLTKPFHLRPSTVRPKASVDQMSSPAERRKGGEVKCNEPGKRQCGELFEPKIHTRQIRFRHCNQPDAHDPRGAKGRGRYVVVPLCVSSCPCRSLSRGETTVERAQESAESGLRGLLLVV